MPYIKRTVQAGRIVEIKKYYSARYGKQSGRGARRNRTPEDVAKLNERYALDKLRWTLNANFQGGDMLLTLTYDSRSEPPSPEDAYRDQKRFLRELRAAYKKDGRELKYISVTEYEAKRIHHHLVVNAIDAQKIYALWEDRPGHGAMRTRYLDASGEYSELAEYLIKETRRSFRSGKTSRKRWDASRNLAKPEIKREVIQRDSWRKTPAPRKGYILDAGSIEVGVDSWSGLPYQSYRLIKIQDINHQRKKERKRE